MGTGDASRGSKAAGAQFNADLHLVPCVASAIFLLHFTGVPRHDSEFQPLCCKTWRSHYSFILYGSCSELARRYGPICELKFDSYDRKCLSNCRIYYCVMYH
jgi:hypothetical protein